MAFRRAIWGIRMKILDDLISTLKKDAPVKDVRQGPFQTAVLTRSCGLASTPHDPGPHHDRNPVQDAGRLVDKEAIKLVQMSYSEIPHGVSVWQDSHHSTGSKPMAIASGIALPRAKNFSLIMFPCFPGVACRARWFRSTTITR